MDYEAAGVSQVGWCGVGAEEIRGLSSVEIKVILETCAKRLIENEWT